MCVPGAAEKQVEAIAIKAGKRPILWEEVFDGGFYEAPTTVVNGACSLACPLVCVAVRHRLCALLSQSGSRRTR